ncbi:MAG TPA: MlaD family protein, partial [Terriglobales bacterium]|nr:MlaD family protein [Terriglobales bacterium]
MPSQKQLKWSQLKVGITVLAASITLAILILLMSGTGGIFTHKMTLVSYFDNAGGLREGAPVRLQGVDIGNVTRIRVVSDPTRQLAPVEVTMKVITKYHQSIRKDSVTTLATAGVLGETYIDINSSVAKGREAQEGDVMATRESPQIEDVVRASQSTLQNMDALLKRVDRIIAYVESGQGSIGKVIYDATLYNQLNATVAQFQGLVANVANGKGSLGKLLVDDQLYRSANDTIDKLNHIIDDLRAGKGTAGKFLSDSTLYDNANKTMASVKQMTDDINAGKGAIGVMARDQEFADKLKKTMNNISELTAELNNPTGSVGKLLHDPALYDNTNNLMVETRSLIKAMRENPKKYLTIHVKIF